MRSGRCCRRSIPRSSRAATIFRLSASSTKPTMDGQQRESADRRFAAECARRRRGLAELRDLPYRDVARRCRRPRTNRRRRCRPTISTSVASCAWSCGCRPIERLAPDRLFPVMEEQGIELDLLDKLIWRIGVLPRFREGLLQTRARPAAADRDAAGLGTRPGRHVQSLQAASSSTSRPSALTPEERIGVADLPAVFEQRPRAGMNLHWDGNNASLAERNLSAAIGAGVTPETVDHDAIERVADWLGDLKPPAEPAHGRIRPPSSAARSIYLAACAGCHGWQERRRLCVRRRATSARSIRSPDSGPTGLGWIPTPKRSGQRQLEELFAGHAVPVPALQEDGRLRQPAARRALAARTLSAQRLGADAGRPAASRRPSGRRPSSAART